MKALRFPVKIYPFEIFTSSLTSTSTLVSSSLVVVIFDITLFVSMRFESGVTISIFYCQRSQGLDRELPNVANVKQIK